MASFNSAGLSQFGGDAAFAQQYMGGGETEDGTPTWLGMLGAYLMDPNYKSKDPTKNTGNAGVPAPGGVDPVKPIEPSSAIPAGNIPAGNSVATPTIQEMPSMDQTHDNINKAFGYNPPPAPVFNQASFSQASSTPATAGFMAPPTVDTSGGGGMPSMPGMGGEEAGGAAGGAGGAAAGGEAAGGMDGIMQMAPMLLALL